MPCQLSLSDAEAPLYRSTVECGTASGANFGKARFYPSARFDGFFEIRRRCRAFGRCGARETRSVRKETDLET